MEIYELIPSTQNKRIWKRNGYGLCGVDENGKTYFNPDLIGHPAPLLALSCGGDCQIHKIDGRRWLLVSVNWAKEMFPSLAGDLDILDARIRRVAAGLPAVEGVN
jgi:hypothetical protein